MLEVVKYLKSTGLSDIESLDKLQETHGIKYSINDKYPLVVLNYHQIDSPKYDLITLECRSLVLELGSFNVVSRSFDRFFNYGEDNLDTVFGIKNQIGYEKMDGSLVTVFNYKGEWLYRTRSMIMPETIINGFEDETWKDLIEKSLLWDTEVFDHAVSPWMSYIFEVTGKANRVVVEYPEKRLATLLAVISNLNGHYLYNDLLDGIADNLSWERPRKYLFDSVEDMLEQAKNLPNLEEGFVMYSPYGVPLYKCKSPAYVAAHHLRGEGLNPRRCMDLVIMGETAEYLTIFPEDLKKLEPAIYAYAELLASMEFVWNLHKDIEEQKDFALKVKDYVFSGALFTKRKNPKLSFEQILQKLNTKAQYNLLTDFGA